MSDLIEGRMSPAVGNATCNAGGKLLKMVEMQYRYGAPGSAAGEEGKNKILHLAAPESVLDTTPVS